jgi:CDP-diacylglycerol--glycerol-3-phosphate 3-phosphatidyltransferase
VTVLGRIMDPFVDKIIICGAFIFLQGKASQGTAGEVLSSGITGWMTFVIVARELFITSLRAFLEQRGKDFSAKWSGKIKMGLQCLAVPMCLLSLSPEFNAWLAAEWSVASFLWWRDVALWGTVAVTVYSGVEYTWRALRMLSNP